MSDWFTENAPKQVSGGNWFQANAPAPADVADAQASAQMRETGAKMQAGVQRLVPHALRGYTPAELDAVTATPNPLTPIQQVTVRDQLNNPYHAGASEIGEGVAQMAQPHLIDTAGGAHKVISGALQVVSPPAMTAGLIAAPVPTLVGLASGTLAQDAVTGGAQALGVPEEYADLAGDLAGLAAGHASAKYVPGAAAKYGARIVENAPQFGADLRNVAGAAKDAVGKDVTRAAAAHAVPVLGHGLSAALAVKAATKLVKAGVFSDLGSAVTDLLTTKTGTELRAANATRTPVWAQGIPDDIAAEMEADAPAPSEPAAPPTLPSGRTPGSFATQSEAPPAPQVSRPAPAWQSIPDAAPVEAPAAPAEPATLPSGRKPGGIQNQPAPAPVQQPLTASEPAAAKPTGDTAPEPAPGEAEHAAPLAPAVADELKTANEDGTLVNLSDEAKAALMDAVLNDHPSIIKHVLQTQEAPTAGLSAVYRNADNKARVFHRYLSETGIDPQTAQQLETGVALIDQFKADNAGALPAKPSIKQYRALAEKTGRLDVVDALEHVQGVADGAHRFAVDNNLPAGKEYQLISPAAWDLVRERFGAKPGERFMGAASQLVPPAPRAPARRLLAPEAAAATVPTKADSVPAPAEAPAPAVADTRSGAQKQADEILAKAKAEAARIVEEAKAQVTPAGNSQTAPAPAQLRDEPTRRETRADGRSDAAEGGALLGPDRAEERASSDDPSHTVVKVPGKEYGYQARYEVRELSQVQPSHSGLNFQPNEKYGLRNDRNYNDPVNQGKVVEWSSRAKFDPTYHITDVSSALDGPVVLDSQGNALGGNGRSMILQRVYAHNPEGAAAYRALLLKKAAQFGVDPAQIRAMKQPVLTRVVDDAEWAPGSGKTKPGAITDLNIKGTADLKPAERAIADSRRVSERTLNDVAQRLEAKGADATLAEILEGKSGVEVFNHLVDDGVIAPQERAAFAKEDVLTPEGKSRIAQLMLGRFFHDPEQLERLAPAIRQKVEKLAAPLAQVEGLGHEWNLTPHLQDALEILDRMRAAATTNIADFVRQDGLFGEAKYAPAAQTLAARLLEKTSTQRQLTDAARSYAEDAQFAAKGDSLFGAPPTPAETFEKYFGKAPAPEPVAAKQSGAEKQAAEAMAKAKAGKAKPASEPEAKPAPKKDRGQLEFEKQAESWGEDAYLAGDDDPEAWYKRQAEQGQFRAHEFDLAEGLAAARRGFEAAKNGKYAEPEPEAKPKRRSLQDIGQ